MSILLEKLMREVKANISEITAGEINNKISAEANVIILDVRSEQNWSEGHLPTAVSCERGMLELNIEKIVPNINQEIITYCGAGTRSALSAESLQRMGYTDVKSLKEGFRGWLNAGFTVENV